VSVPVSVAVGMRRGCLEVIVLFLDMVPWILAHRVVGGALGDLVLWSRGDCVLQSGHGGRKRGRSSGRRVDRVHYQGVKERTR